MITPTPHNEAERLEALREYEVLDSPPEQDFDDIVRLASQICGTPISVISLVDDDRQWFKAKIGLESTETMRDLSFCSHAMRSPALMVVPDATQDPRFEANALVTVEGGIRFYAGAPLISPDGHGLGALCVIDRIPRTLTHDQETALQTLSRHVMAQLNLRRQNRDMKRAEASLLGILEDQIAAEKALRESQERFQVAVSGSSAGLWDWNLRSDETYYSPRFRQLLGYSESEFPSDFAAFFHLLHPDDRSRVTAAVDSHIKDGAPYDIEYQLLTKCGDHRWFNARGQALWDNTGKAYRMAGSIVDIHERKLADANLQRANRSLRMLSQCNEALNRLDSEHALLTEICEISVQTGGNRMAWVGYAEDNPEKRVVPQASAGAEEGYLELLKVSWAEDRPEGRGPAGRAIRGGQPIMVADLAEDPFFTPWLKEASDRGYEGVVCVPLKNKQRAFGVLVLYMGTNGGATPEEVELLRELADNLAYGIDAIRNRDAQRRLHEVVLAIAQAVSSGVGQEFFDSLNEHMVSVLRADLGFIAVLDGQNQKSARALTAIVDGGVVANFQYELTGTPCEQVLEGRMCVVDRGVAQLFPSDRTLVDLRAESYVGIPLKNSKGTVIGLMAVVFRRPITGEAFISSALQIFAARAASEIERQQADAQVREQAALLDKAQDAILVRDLDHKITYWNLGAERLYGWSAAEAIGRSSAELFYSDPTEFLAAHQAVLTGTEWVGEIVQRNKAGDHINAEGRWTLVHDERGLPQAVLAINTDVTERKRDQNRIAQALREKEVMLKEIHHRVKNNLQVISSLLSLQSDLVEDSVARELLTESQHRVRSMAMIHEKLYQSEDLARVDFGEYVNSLVGFLFRSYSNAVGQVALKISCDQVFLNIDTASPCGLMLNELVSNALKHAFPDGRSGELRVELRQEQAGYSLTVSDTGIGLPENFDWKQSQSLGMQLVDTLAKQIKATMKIDGAGGASFRLDFNELIYTTRD